MLSNKTDNPFTNVCWVSVLTHFCHEILAVSDKAINQNEETINDEALYATAAGCFEGKCRCCASCKEIKVQQRDSIFSWRYSDAFEVRNRMRRKLNNPKTMS